MPPETEPVSFYLTLPYNEAVSYSVDEDHVEANRKSGNKDIRLVYHEDDKAEFSFQTADTVRVMEIYLRDTEKQEYSFSIDENRKISFFMPAKDLELTFTMEEIPVSGPVSETEQPDGSASAAEAESTWEHPANPDEGINEFDLTAQEVAGDQTGYTPEDLILEDDLADEIDGNISNDVNMKDISTQTNSENGDRDAGTETGDDLSDAAGETVEVPEDGHDETSGEDSTPDSARSGDLVAHIARFQAENSQFIDDRRELRKRREHPHPGVGGDNWRPFQEIVRTHIQEL